MSRRLISLFFAFAFWLVAMGGSAPAAAAKGEKKGGLPTACNSPRAAAMMVFAWKTNDVMASRCFANTGRTRDERKRLARKVRDVYDYRGYYINMERLSADKDWVNPDTGQHRVSVDPRLPAVVVTREKDGRWVWSKGSLDLIEGLSEENMVRSFGERLPKPLQTKFLGVQFWQYLAIALMLVIGVLVRKIIEILAMSRLRKLAETLGQDWASRTVTLFSAPGATLVMAAMLAAVHPMLGLPIGASVVMKVAVHLLLVLSVVWAAYRIVDMLAEYMAQRAASTDSKLDDQLVPLVRKLLKVVVLVAGVIFVLQNMNIDVGSLLAGLSIGGLAFAFAAKDTLANFFGSIVIFADRPFQIGDWVVVAGAEGVIEEVGFRSTRVRAFDNSLISIPNAKFTETVIHNFGEREYRRCTFKVGLTYDTTPEQMQAFVEGVRAIICANKHTRKDYYEVHFNGMGAHSLDVLVYFFFDVDTWSRELAEKHNVLLEIMRLASALNVGFAFPTQTLHVEQLGGAERIVPTPHERQKMADVIRGFGPAGSLAQPRSKLLTHGYLVESDRVTGDTETESDIDGEGDGDGAN